MAPTTVAILGAGRGGSALLDLLHQIPAIEIAGIMDRDPAAPGLRRARELKIPITNRAEDLIANPDVDLIMDVTGDPAMEGVIHRHKTPGTDVLNGSTSRVLWELVRHEAGLQTELFQAEKLAGMGSFAAGIAHDINNPLQLILGLAENLVDERDLTVVHEQAKEIIDAVRRTSAICRDLTYYARKSSNRDDMIVNLNGRLEEALKIARYATSFHDIVVLAQYEPGACTKGNPDELLHAFVNLITNAVQAMDQEGGTLTLKTKMQDGTAHISISDTGCGMPPETLDRIFEAFFTTKEPGKGTGLGLYNVKTIVQKLHGTITVDSQVDKGTTFTIMLPSEEEVRP
ncbi:MAG TPA: ATP-binding protein [Nitrospira sp.]|nr:ATP-binding protein [Nitrospira sp.]